VPVVQELRSLGHDVLTTREYGKADQAIPDPEVLAFAKQQNRALLTLNRRHFIRLHRENPEHAGVVVCKFDPDFSRQAHRIHETIRNLESIAGQLIRINRA